MEQTPQTKKSPCYCTALSGVAVIILAWWNVGWAPVALTVIGALIVVKTFVNTCCFDKICGDKTCTPK
ncbi:MAG: hypothetical protein KTQ49_02250 [Candidatus Omnitrophica bacterium]|nr:hypothetical protein [Candidatus Omnitrophota bacterium]